MHSNKIFLSVQVGDIVIIKSNDNDATERFWVGQVIHKAGNSLNPNENTIFQIANVDTGIISSINADLVIEILIKNINQSHTNYTDK